MKLLRLLAILILFTASEVNAAQFGGVEELSVNLSPQYFQWEEFYNGRRLLREQGWLVGAGPLLYLNLLQSEPAGSLLLKGKAEVFGGVVGYTGETQPPNTFPVRTDVSYVGVKGEIDLGWRLTVKKISVEPFGGVGYRWWLRDLQDSTAVDNSGNLVKVSGYTESWQSGYARAGGRIGYKVTDDWRAFCEGGAKYPFYTSNTVDFTETGELTTKPGGRWSAFAEIGAIYRKIRLSAFYEGFRYDQSPVVASGTLRVFQPKSESDLFGFSLGWVFR